MHTMTELSVSTSEPDRRSGVREHAGNQVNAAEPMQTAHGQQPQVLQVALGPASVACGVVDHVGRHFLPASAHVGRQPDLVAGAAHECGFDKVVAEDLAAERRLARQRRQIAELGELAQPQDGVVAPVVAFAELPVRPGRSPAWGCSNARQTG